MAETAEVTGAATTETAGVSESTSEAQETAAQNQTLEEIVTEELDKGKEAETEGAEEGEKKPGRPHLTAQERIRQLNEQKKTAETRATEAEGKASQMSEGMESLKAELAGIKAMLKAGVMSKPEAAMATAAAKDTFQEAIDGLELPEELQPFRDSLVTLASQIAQSVIQSKIAPLEQAEKQRQTEARQRETETFQAKTVNSFKEAAKDFPELFDGEDENGFPVFKPEYEKRAMELAETFNVPFTDPETGQKGFYNPAIVTKEGQRMLLNMIYRDLDAAKRAKESIEKTNEAVRQAKKGRIESPESTRGTSAKKQSLEQIVESTIKEMR